MKIILIAMGILLVLIYLAYVKMLSEIYIFVYIELYNNINNIYKTY